MKNLWKFIKQGALPVIFALIAIGCGNTGPDGNKEGNSGQVDPVGNSRSSVGNSPASSASSSAHASGFTASMPDLVLLEGTPLMEYNGSGAHILEGGQDPVAILNFSLNKPLTADASVGLVINEELTNCQKGYLNRPLLPEDPTAFPKGTSQLSLKVTARRDDFVDEDCQAQFSLKVAYPDREELIHAAGKLTLKDDDVETGNTYLDYNHASIRRGFGDVSQYALNGSRAFTGQTYEVEQLAGVPAIFNVVKDKLRVLIPASDTGARDGDDQFPFVFLVKPSNAPSFKVWWSAWTSLDEPIYEMDEGEYEDSTIYDRTGIKTLSASGYIRDHFYDGDLTKLSWSLTTAQPSNVVKLDSGNNPLHPSDITVTPEEAKIIEQGKGIYLDADNRTIRITPAAAVVLSRYINDTKTFKLGLDVRTCVDASENAECIYTTVFISLRPAIKTININIAGIDSELLKTPNRFFVVVRDMYEGTDRYTTRILPLTKPNLIFDAMHTAQYKTILVDMQGEYYGDASQPLYEQEQNKTITIEASSSGSAVGAKSTVKRPVAKLQKSTAAGCEELGDDVYELISGEKDKEMSCSHTFTTDELRGDVEDTSRQLVVEVETLEFPSFSSKEGTKFNDSWSYSLTATGTPLDLSQKEGGIVSATHTSKRMNVYASPCFTLGKDAANTATFSAKAQNVGDNQLNTKIRAKVIDCKQVFNIQLARVLNRGERGKRKITSSDQPISRDFKFAHPNKSVNNKTPLLAIPINLNKSAYESDNNKFSFEATLTPLIDTVDASKIEVTSVELFLDYTPEDGTARGQELLLSTLTQTTTPALSITDKKDPDPKIDKIVGKTLLVKDYKLPNLASFPVELHLAKKVRLLAKIKVATGDGTFLQQEFIKFNDGLPNILLRAEYAPLIELDALRNQVAPDESRATWADSTNRYGSLVNGSARDDDKGRDAWMVPELWKNLYVRKLNYQGEKCTDATNVGKGACTSGLSDTVGKTSSGLEKTIPDYLDELRVNDISAIHVACFAPIIDTKVTDIELETYKHGGKDNKCRSVIDHWSHHDGLSMDLRYLDEEGKVSDGGLHGSGGTNGIFAEWHKANNSRGNVTAADQEAARKKIRKWILINRKLAEWIHEEVKDTTTPLKEVKYGTSKPKHKWTETDPITGKEIKKESKDASASIYELMKSGSLPGNDFAGADDDSPGAWALPNDLNINDEPPHDDHFHLDFKSPF